MSNIPLFLVLVSLGCVVAEARGSGVRPRTMKDPPRWSQIEAGQGPTPRLFASVTPCGEFVAIVGGVGADGAAVSDSWRWRDGVWVPLPREGAPSPRVGHAAVWTGDRLCVWGGAVGRGGVNDGACWRAADDRWVPMRSDGAPSPRRRHALAWVGGRVMVFGGEDDDGETLGDGALYDPARDVWTSLPEGGPRPRADAWLVPYGGRVAVGGGVGEALALGADDGAWFDPSANLWVAFDVRGGPAAAEGAVIVGAAGGLLALGEAVSRFDPAQGSWRARSDAGAPSRRWSAAAAEVPGGAVVWGGVDGSVRLGDGARYDLEADRWSPLPADGAPSARQDALAFFDGARLVILWGSNEAGLLADGYTLPLG